MQENIITKKSLPYEATKQEIYGMYKGQYSIATMRKIINTILEDKTILPKMRIEDRPNKHSNLIPHPFFMELVDTVGIPEGYQIID